jgi:hypothetical protein
MSDFIGKSGRRYSSLPIDNTLGFPQTFSLVFNSQTYHFWLYVNIAATTLAQEFTVLSIPTKTAFLVVRVERDLGNEQRETIFLRKVFPELEYAAEKVAIAFPSQIIARQNLNGQGDFGSEVVGGIAERWA